MKRGLLIIALAATCSRNAPEPADVTPQHDNASAIPDHPVRGTLRGVAFETLDARYVVHRQIGREKVDIRLSASGSKSPCGSLDDANAAAVWIRFPGTEVPAAGERRRGSSEEGAGFEVHYQVRQEGRWVGSGRGAALLSIHDTKQHDIEAELSVCFADGRGSCAAGSFKAHLCPDTVSPDVRNLDTRAAPGAGD